MRASNYLFYFSILWLAGCVSESSRYDQEMDGPPNEPLYPHQVLDAIPVPDPILEQGNISPYVVNGVTYEVLNKYQDYSSEGIASWYGVKFHGRKTSNGEIFDMRLATAAHKSLPIPCYVSVTNLENGRSMIVRVNDRGPFHPNRIIDLSYAAAIKLGFADMGVARVNIEIINVAGVDDRRLKTKGQYRYLQLGAFQSRSSADLLVRKLQLFTDSSVTVSSVQMGKIILYRVRVGPFSSNSEVSAEKTMLESNGFSSLQPLP